MYTPKLIIFFCIIYIVSAKETMSCCEGPGYYWREYNGEMPCDAVVAGNDKEDKPVYIGQAVHSASYSLVLQPGHIHADNKTLTYAWYGHVYTSNRFKVLCSNTPSYLKWLQSDTKTISKELSLRRFIIAGYDIETKDEYPLLVGRVRVGDQTFVGKVTEYQKWAGMRYTENNKIEDPATFEVLYYDSHL